VQVLALTFNRLVRPLKACVRARSASAVLNSSRNRAPVAGLAVAGLLWR
jgi:hypothetical protein